MRRITPLSTKCCGKISYMLSTGTWTNCSPNPFSRLPSKIVDELMMECYKYSFLLYSQPECFLSLLISGKLRRLNLDHFNLVKYHDLFLRVIRENGGRSLRFLYYMKEQPGCASLVENLVLTCPNLEEFHSVVFLQLRVFKNCTDLKLLRLYLRRRWYHYDLDYAVLASLKNLQELYIYDMDSNLVAHALDNCPQLITLGISDSLDGLDKINEIYKRRNLSSCTEVSGNFKLRRCLWGKGTDSHFERGTIFDPIESPSDVLLYKSDFPKKMKVAVSLCPYVEELVVYVYHKDSIEELKNLKRLFFLNICFLNCDGDYLPHFFKLLQVIGSQLKHLSVAGGKSFPVDIICDFCPNLSTLEIVGRATVQNSVETNDNILLKNLRISDVADRKALLFLLISSKGLEKLYLGQAFYLRGNLLDQILDLNPLSHLRISSMNHSSLSEEAVETFIQKIVSLETVEFSASKEETDKISKKIKQLGLTNIKCNMLTYIRTNEFYFGKLNKFRF